MPAFVVGTLTLRGDGQEAATSVAKTRTYVEPPQRRGPLFAQNTLPQAKAGPDLLVSFTEILRVSHDGGTFGRGCAKSVSAGIR